MSFDFSRRAFVVGAATIAAAPAAVCAADLKPPVAAAGIAEPVPFRFDPVAFAAVLNRPYKHRQVYAGTSYAIARDGLNLMRNSIDAYNDPMYFAEGPNAMHGAAVYYHGTSPLLALDDAMYAKYPLADAIVAAAGTAKPGIDKGATANPAAPAFGKLVADHGASFFICNNALSGAAANIAQLLATPASPATRAQVVAIHDDFVAHFLPGAFLVPAGVAALNAAQEARFTYLTP